MAKDHFFKKYCPTPTKKNYSHKEILFYLELLPRFKHSNWCFDFEMPPPFNIRWDWLMPVVEKIEKTGYLFMIVKNEAGVSTSKSSGLSRSACGSSKGSTKLEATYTAVLNFIKEYKK